MNSDLQEGKKYKGYNPKKKKWYTGTLNIINACNCDDENKCYDELYYELEIVKNIDGVEFKAVVEVEKESLILYELEASKTMLDLTNMNNIVGIKLPDTKRSIILAYVMDVRYEAFKSHFEVYREKLANVDNSHKLIVEFAISRNGNT